MRALDWLSLCPAELSPKGYWGGDQDPAEKRKTETIPNTVTTRITSAVRWETIPNTALSLPE